MNAKRKQALAAGLGLLTLMLCYCFIAASSRTAAAASSSALASLASAAASPFRGSAALGPGGGDDGGLPPLPLPLPSAMIVPHQVRGDSPSCDLLQSTVMKHEADSWQDKAHADTVLMLIEMNTGLIRGLCSPVSQAWFLEPQTKALNELGRYEATVGLLDSDTLSALLSDRKAVALMRLGRYREAEPLYVRAESLYRAIPQTRAMLRVNHAWNLFYLERYEEARERLDDAAPVLFAACCNPAVVFFITEMEKLRGRMAGKGLAEPQDQRRRGVGLAFVVLIIAVGVGLLVVSQAAKRETR